jgi:hypothetical protein
VKGSGEAEPVVSEQVKADLGAGSVMFGGFKIRIFLVNEFDEQNCKLKKNRPRERTGSTGTEKALTSIGRNQAGSFLWLLSFAAKRTAKPS